MSSSEITKYNRLMIPLIVLLGFITLLGFGDSLEQGWKWLLSALLTGIIIGYSIRIKLPHLYQTRTVWNHGFVYGIMVFVFISRYLSDSWQLAFQCGAVLLYFCFITIQFPHLLAPFGSYSNLIQLWWFGLITLTVVLNGALKMILTEVGLTILISCQIVLALLLYFVMIRIKESPSLVSIEEKNIPQTDSNLGKTKPSILKKFMILILKVIILCGYLPLLAPILYVTEDSRIFFDVRLLLPIPTALWLLVVIEEGVFLLVGLGLKVMISKPKLEYLIRHVFSMLVGAAIMTGVFIIINLSLDIDFWLMIVGLFAHAFLSLFAILFIGTICLKWIEKITTL